MPINPNFPSDPYAILDPEVRWYPGEKEIEEVGYAKLIPPLVYQIRKGVKAWRDNLYEGACETTKALLSWWFKEDHFITNKDGVSQKFRYYFAQREAVETAIWLYEIEHAKDSRALLKYDLRGELDARLFKEDWTRYVFKMATGAGKTKVMSLLTLWSYYHKKYEPGSDLSTNFLINAPNIIVLDRLRSDFDGLKIFRNDPMIPDNGYGVFGRDWKDDFQINLHIQDQIGNISEHGNIFLTNIHRVFVSKRQASIDDNDTKDYFFGKRPTGKTNESEVDLGKIIRAVPDLVVINDEAHHIHDEDLAWYKNIQEIHDGLKKRGSKISVQFDLTATPKHTDGSIFVNTVSDYPLVEAIQQKVVKQPVLPDKPSREKLKENPSEKFSEMYADYINLGVHEWKKTFDEHKKMVKKPVLFVMTEDTRDCDDVGDYLESTFPELNGKVLVIHTKNNGEISEASTGKSKDELDKLRKDSREIDDFYNKYSAIVSVMMLREGWDVQNVVTIVGLKPFKSKNKILPEQTLGRGLRRMYRGDDTAVERVSVIGTDAFMDFVESIKIEGVVLPTTTMKTEKEGDDLPPPIVTIYPVDEKIGEFDISIPVLSSKLDRNWKKLDMIDVDSIKIKPVKMKQFNKEDIKRIVFRDIINEEVTHITDLDYDCNPCYQNIVGYFVNTLMRELHLPYGFDILFGKVKNFIQFKLFGKEVTLEDPYILRNLAEEESTKLIINTFKNLINSLTVCEVVTTNIIDTIKISSTRPYRVENKLTLKDPKKCLFNYFKGDSQFEYDFANFLDCSSDVVSWYKNDMHINFSIEYQKTDGNIGRYFPDFVVKLDDGHTWIVETKGIDDDDSKRKYQRLVVWVDDQNRQKDKNTTYHSMKVMFADWNKRLKDRPIKNFKHLIECFSKEEKQ